MLTSIPGTNDILHNSPSYFCNEPVIRHITETARHILQAVGAHMVYTPMFEAAEVFQKGVGTTSDIVVKKEMYTFEDRGDRLLALRPELTAPMVRAYNQHKLYTQPQPVKLFTWGPAFRAERHQKGRYKQFHQVSYEVLGSTDALIDAETIATMVSIYRAVGLKNLTVKLGSVGDPDDRVAYNQYLRELLSPHQDSLSEDSKTRLSTNPMRILDSKSPQDQELLTQLQPKPMLDFLGEDSRAFNLAVVSYLEALNIPFEIDPSIVRGLDYYMRTAWEVHHEGVGAKSALGGGGRYDGLSEMLGGKATAGVGFGIGIERMAIAMQDEGIALPTVNALDVYLVPLEEAAKLEVFKLAFALRPQYRVEFGPVAKKIGKAFEEAEKRGARWVGFMGSNELESGTISLKNLITGEKKTVDTASLAQHFGTTP